MTRVCVNTQRFERSTLSCQSKEKGHPFRVWRVSSAMEHMFSETALQARTQASTCLAKAIKASHGPSVSPQSQAEEKVKKTLENPPEGSYGQAKVRFQGSKSTPRDFGQPKVRSKFPNAEATVKHCKRVSQFLKT